MRINGSLSQIRMQVMWNRLVSLVEEQAQTLIRSAFSATVREAGDLSAGIFDPHGRMLAQAVTGTPGHVNSMATAVTHFLARYPIKTMSPGDSYVTNDPWLTSGHLHDFTVVTPAFHQDRPIALFAATIHVVDVGGRGLGPNARQIFEEGLLIPIMPLARRGMMNADLFDILRANNREPAQVEGDLFSCAAAGERGAIRLVDMMVEFEINNLSELAEHIIVNSREGMMRAIHRLPYGVYHNSMTFDGYEAPVTVQAALTVSEKGIHVDYGGTSPPSAFGINVVLNYSAAYTCFGIRCAIAPDVPNNYGSMSPITVTAPEDCVLNVQKPAPVAARHVVGHMTTDVMLGCLHHIVNGGLPAECANAWNPMMRGGVWFDNTKRVWELYLFFSGGMGARPDKDGLSTTHFPGGVRIVPIEAAEAVAPLLFWRKELRPNSGGPGEFRGGLGQVLEIASATDGPIAVQAMFDRIHYPARGRNGGEPGSTGKVLRQGKLLAGKGQHDILPDQVLRLELPGGGGMGDPFARSPEKVADDIVDGLVTSQVARDSYGVVLGADGRPDLAATALLRASIMKSPVGDHQKIG